MKAYLTLISLFLLSSPAYGEWEYSGSAGTYFQDLAVPASTVTQSEKAGLTLDLSLENKLSSQWKFKTDLFMRTDFVARDSTEFFQFMPQNFYLQKRNKNFTWRFGLQTLSIDGPDVVNPADILHAKNWIDPTAPQSFGSAGLSMNYESGDWNWEVSYVPRQTTPVLPGEHSPWLPRKNRLPIESEDTEVRIPDNVQYQYLGATELNNALNNNISLKLQQKSESLETQLIYYNGLAQSPFLLTGITGTLISVNPDIIAVDSPVKLRPLYYRQHAIAGTFNMPFESWAIHGGFNWLSPQGNDDRIPDETSLMTLGMEKSVETSIGMITGVLDYIRQKKQDENQISFLRSIFEEAVTLGARIPYGEETSLILGGLYDLKGQSSLYKFSLHHRLTNSWTFEGGAQFLQGPPDTLIGLYDNYDSYYINFRFNW